MSTKTKFDDILENKIKLGYYHYMVYLFTSFIYVADGAEIVCMSLTLPIIKKEWNISQELQSLLGAILFFGIFVGSISAGVISDKYGRRKAILYSTFIQFCVGILSTTASGVYSFLFFRGLFGILIGFTIPLAPSLLSEITPVKLRGKGIVITNFFFSIGSLYGCLIAYFILDSLTSGNWKLMLVLSSVPSLVVWYGTLKLTEESPRFEVIMGRTENGLRILNKIGTMNDPQFTVLDKSVIEELNIWRKDIYNETEVATVGPLFNGINLVITTVLLIMWFGLNVTYYGTIFISPFIFSYYDTQKQSQTQSGLANLTITVAGELPSVFLALLVIDRKGFGRKKSMILSLFLSCACLLLASLMEVNGIVFFLSLTRCFIKTGFAIIYPFSSEVYPTVYRTVGMGVTSGFGRLGATVMPYLSFWLFSMSPKAPLVGYAFCTLISGISGFFLPYDTRGRYLDVKGEAKENYIELAEVGTEQEQQEIQNKLLS